MEIDHTYFLISLKWIDRKFIIIVIYKRHYLLFLSLCVLLLSWEMRLISLLFYACDSRQRKTWKSDVSGFNFCFFTTIDEILRSVYFVLVYVWWYRIALYIFVYILFIVKRNFAWSIYAIKVRFIFGFLLKWKGKSQILLFLVPYALVRFLFFTLTRCCWLLWLLGICTGLKD